MAMHGSTCTVVVTQLWVDDYPAQDLINQAQGKQKQMVFSSYFAQPGSPAAAKGAHGVAGLKSGLGRAAGPGGVGKDGYEMGTVPESEEVAPPGPGVVSPRTPAKKPDGPAPSAAESQVHAAPASKPSSASQQAHVQVAAPAAPAPQQVPAAAAAVAAAAVVAPRPKASTAAPAAPAAEEGGKRTKLLAISPNLPNSMARKSWSLSDYSVVRKMYTGYASTVYQVG